ncbi:MAG: hypothetical protein ACYC7D_15400 [Nitrososphaerales archaeon]
MSIKRQTMAYGVVAVIIAVSLIVGAVVYSPAVTTSIRPSSTTSTTTSSIGGQTTTGTTPFIVLLTDPAIVPNGTTSLNLTYSNIAIHTKLNGSSQWVLSNASGSVDLLQLVNVSKTLAVSSIQNGSIVDQISFDIVLVQINVNGTVYNVTTPNSRLIVPITENRTIQQLSGALVDLSPKVVEIITGNSSAPIFVLIPSATAIIRYGSEITTQQTHVGNEENLTSNDAHQIEAANGNVTILSASISSAGNETNISVTLKNTGNVSIALSGLSIQGVFNTTISSTSVCSNTTSQHTESGDGENNSTTTIGENNTTTATTSDGENNSTTTTNSSDNGQHDSVVSYVAVASPKDAHGNTSAASDHGCGEASHEFEQPHELVFATSANSTTISPIFSEDHSNSSLILQPNETITLTYTGTIMFASGGNEGYSMVNAAIVPVLGDSYTISLSLSGDNTSSIQVVST